MPFLEFHSLTCFNIVLVLEVWPMADNAEFIMLHKVARLVARTLLILCFSVHCAAIAWSSWT